MTTGLAVVVSGIWLAGIAATSGEIRQTDHLPLGIGYLHSRGAVVVNGHHLDRFEQVWIAEGDSIRVESGYAFIRSSDPECERRLLPGTTFVVGRCDSSEQRHRSFLQRIAEAVRLLDSLVTKPEERVNLARRGKTIGAWPDSVRFGPNANMVFAIPPDFACQEVYISRLADNARASGPMFFSTDSNLRIFSVAEAERGISAQSFASPGRYMWWASCDRSIWLNGTFEILDEEQIRAELRAAGLGQLNQDDSTMVLASEILLERCGILLGQ